MHLYRMYLYKTRRCTEYNYR